MARKDDRQQTLELAEPGESAGTAPQQATVQAEGTLATVPENDEDSPSQDASGYAEPTFQIARLATPALVEQAIQRALAQVDAVKRLKLALLSLTNKADWYAFGGEEDSLEDTTPYLTAGGCHKVIHAFGIVPEIQSVERAAVEEGGYEYIVIGTMKCSLFSDVPYPVVGSRWSDDGFFTRGGKVRADPGDVRKAAMENWYNRGIKTVTGTKNLTWEEIESVPHLAGLSKTVKRLDYGSRGKGSGGGPAQPGERSEIEQGPHITIKIPKEDLTTRNAIKALPTRDRTWSGASMCWVIRWNANNWKRVLDLKASARTIEVDLKNVPEEELP